MSDDPRQPPTTAETPPPVGADTPPARPGLTLAVTPPAVAPQGATTPPTGPDWFDWYWRHFMKGVCFHLPLVFLLVSLLLLPFNLFGEGLGVVHLIWHEDLGTRAFVGAAMAVLALETLFVSYLLWASAVRAGRLGPDREPDLSFNRFALNTAVCLVATVGVFVGLYVLVWLVNPSAYPSTGRAPEWWAAATVRAEGWRGVGNACVLPAGALVVVAVPVVAAWLGLGQWLAGRELPDRVRNRLETFAAAEVDPAKSRLQWGARVVVTLVWVAAAVAGWWLGRSVTLVVFAAGGLALFWAAVRAADATGRPRAADWLFWLNLPTHALLGFVWMTFCLSKNLGFGVLVPVLVGGVAAGCLAFSVPRPAHDWLGRRLRDESAGGSRPDAAPDVDLQLWPWAVLAGLVFYLTCDYFWPSPATIVCFFLSGVVVLYGVATRVVRRAVPAVVAALLFFAVLAGVQPYKFRYDGDGRAGGLGDYTAPLRLAEAARADTERQREFDAYLLDTYEPALSRHRRQQGYSAELRANLEPLFGPTGAWAVAQALRTDPGAERAYRESCAGLREKWDAMDRENRVIAGRRDRQDLGLDVLYQGEDGRRRADDGRRLIDVRDWPLDPVKPDQHRPLVVVAVSGGGLRAAAWTYQVLAGLEERFWSAPGSVDFPDHVRLVTGASGGMLGAAYYVATLRPRAERKPADPTYREERRRQLKEGFDKLVADQLTPLVKQSVHGDLPNMLSPWAARHDRGKELEATWSRNLGGALDKSFAELRARELALDIPSLVFTPVLVEDGRRLIVSNLDMRNAITNDGNLLPKSADDRGLECYSRTAFELFRLFPAAPEEFRLGAAVRMNASFPFFSPAVSLPTSPRLRVVDAGYYDNYGVSLLASWLMGGNNRAWVRDRYSSVLLVQIRDGLDHRSRRLDKVGEDESSKLSRSAEELSSPFEAAYNTLFSSASFRNDEMLELMCHFQEVLDERRSAKVVARVGQQLRTFQVVNFEFPGRAALSWYLSPREREEIRKALTEESENPDCRRGIDAVVEWWGRENKFFR